MNSEYSTQYSELIVHSLGKIRIKSSLEALRNGEKWQKKTQFSLG